MTPGLRYRNLGKSGLRASNVGLQFQSMAEDPAEASAVVRLAIESGINLFEVGDFQGEVELGRILKKGNWKRTSYIVTTKIFWSTKSDEKGLSRKYIIEAVKASLQRLQLNYIDVVIIHRMDPMCPCEEICRAMNYVISQGMGRERCFTYKVWVNNGRLFLRLGDVLGLVSLVGRGNYGGLFQLSTIQLHHSDRGTDRVPHVQSVSKVKKRSWLIFI